MPWMTLGYSPEIEGEYVFEPAGTSFQADTLFALNTHGLLGYFKGYEKTAIESEISHPNHLYGASSIKSTQKANKDLFTAHSYQEIVDAPILYSVPDTLNASIRQERGVDRVQPNQTINSGTNR
jgi:predicted metalloprotease with PDZ domain